MGFFKKIFQRRASPLLRAEDVILQLASGEDHVTREMALNVPSLAGCVDFIANTIAMLPIELKRDDETDDNDERVRMLNSITGDSMDAYQMKKAWITDMLLDGSGYIYIRRRRNRVRGLYYVARRYVSVLENTDPIVKDCDVMVNGQRYREYEFLTITRQTDNGVNGRGVIEENNKILSVAYNALEFENNLVKSGGKKGFLKTEKRIEESAMEKLKQQWKSFYGKNSENVIVLNSGIDFKEASLSSVEMQLNENKKSNAEEICKLFNLSSDIIDGTCTDEVYNNGIKTAVLPIIKAIETSLDKDLLLESEHGRMHFRIDTKSLLKGDMEKRYSAYRTAIEGNIMQIDEARKLEGLPPLGLDFIKLGLNDVLYYPGSDMVYTPNTNKMVKTDAQMIPSPEEGSDNEDENRNTQ